MHGEQDHALLLYVIEPGGIQIPVKAHRLTVFASPKSC